MGAVEEDVCGLENRVVVETDARGLGPALTRLVLELGHARELADFGYTVEKPGELGVRGDAALSEDHRPLRVEPDRKEDSRELTHVVPEHLRVLGHRDGVQVHDAEIAVVVVLYGHPVLQSAKIGPEVGRAARLDTAEHPLSVLHGAYFSGRTENRCTPD